MIKQIKFRLPEGETLGQKEEYILLPIYWSKDDRGNVSYDTDSIREDFDQAILDLETSEN
jgi:hypothetical protein